MSINPEQETTHDPNDLTKRYIRSEEIVEGDPGNVASRREESRFLKTLYEEASDASFIHDPQIHLKRAQLFHPARLCAKDVYAASLIRTNLGEIVMYTRNGMQSATPKHLNEYNVDNLTRIARKLPDSNERLAILNYLKSLNPKQLTNCLAIANLSGTRHCLKGFNYDDSTQRARYPSDEYCPNSRAGCSERNLLYWLPYALFLQRQLGSAPFITVTEVIFSNDNDFPVVRYQLENGEVAVKQIEGKLNPNEVLDLEQNLIVSLTPCTVCTPKIIELGVNCVTIEKYSKYPVSENYCYVDEDDLNSLTLLKNSGVRINHFLGARRPILREY